MSYMKEVEDEIRAEQAEEKPAEPEVTKEPEVETPAEPPKEEETPREEPPKEEPPKEEPPKEEPEPEPKKDTSQFSKEEKAEFAFRRQLGKQKAKHEQEIADLKESFQKQFDDLKASLKTPEPEKTRADFPSDKGGDDAYIKYLANQQVEAIMKERDAKAAEERASREKDEKAAQEEYERSQQTMRKFAENAHAAYPDEKSFGDFSSKVNRALDNGLGELLDRVPVIRDYVFERPEGAKVLDAMLSDKKTFERIFSRAGNPNMCLLEMYDLAGEIRNRPAEPEAPEEEVKVAKIGKPGASGTPAGTVSSIWNDDRELIKFVRQRRGRA